MKGEARNVSYIFSPWYWNFSCVVLYLSDSTLHTCELFSIIKTKARQFTCDHVNYHAGNSIYIVYTYQIFITVFTP